MKRSITIRDDGWTMALLEPKSSPRAIAPLLLSCLAVVMGVHGAAAQLAGVPTWAVGLPNSTVRLQLVAGIHTTSGDDFVGPDTKADPGATAALQTLLAGRFTLRAGGGFTHRDVSATEREIRPQGFALVGANVIHWRNGIGNLGLGASLMGGGGLSSLPDDMRQQHVIVGVDVSATIGLGGVFINPSVVPHWSWRRTDFGEDRFWQDGFAMSAGATVELPWGLSLNFAGERASLADDFAPLGPPEITVYSWSLALIWPLLLGY